MGMFSAPLRRNVGDRALQHLEQSLLHTFAGDIARNRGVFVFPADLVDLIDINNAGLSAFHIATGILDQPEDNVFNVFTNVTGLSKRRGIHYRKRDAEQPREGLREERLTRAGWSNQQDVGFLKLDVGLLP